MVKNDFGDPSTPLLPLSMSNRVKQYVQSHEVEKSQKRQKLLLQRLNRSRYASHDVNNYPHKTSTNPN